MPDISMCRNATCPHNLTCYRYNAVPDQYWQSYGAFKPDENGECEYYRPMSSKDQNVQVSDTIKDDQ